MMISTAVAGVLLTVLFVANRPTGSEKIGGPSAQSNLRSALAAAGRIAERDGSYANATPLHVQALEPSLVFIGGDEASNDPRVISVSFTPTLWVGAARSASGACYWIRDDLAGGTTFGSSTDCAADRLRTAPGSASGWPTA